MTLPTKYTKLSIFGNQYIDYLWVRDKVIEPSAEELVYNYAPQWNSDTMLLATYENSINGGNITSLQENVVSWLVYRLDRSSSTLKFIAKLPVAQSSLIDYMVQNQKEYQYVVFPETASYLGAPMESAFVTTDWWNWSITDLIATETTNLYKADTENTWLFELDIASSDITHNFDAQLIETMAQFPKVSIGEQNYISSGLNCYLGNVSNAQYINDTPDKQQQFRDFVKNGRLKLLKDRKGNAYIISIISSSFQNNDSLQEQPTKISISWVQLDKIDNYSVIE